MASDARPGDLPASGTSSPEPEGAITIRYLTRLDEYVRCMVYATRRSDLVFGFGVAALLAAALTLATGRVLEAVPIALLGVAFITGLFAAPFAWFAGRGRFAGLEFEDVIDRTGIRETSPLLSAQIAWTRYREVEETNDVFYVAAEGLSLGFLPKRAFTAHQLEAFRRLVAELGLRPRRRWRRRLLVTFGVLAFFVGIGLLSIFVGRLQAVPRLEVAATVDGRQVNVHGTTDLPDDALIAVEVFHLAEYSRWLASGNQPSADSPWVMYLYRQVKAGAFDASFDTSAWPPGRARVVAFFHASIQPDGVIDRYGDKGQKLSGPNVHLAEDGSRQIEVVAHVELR